MLPELMERFRVPGVAAGTLSDGVEDISTAGVTSIDNPLPVQPTTLFQIGSITKTITATAILRLIEQSVVELEAPVRRYLPDLRLSDEDVASRLTLRHLLTHSAGFVGDFFEDTGWGDDALERYVTMLADLPQLVPLGALFSYCNSGFAVAGRVIERMCGKSYEQATRELVLEPLGMHHSYFFPAEVMTHRFVVGHQSPFDPAEDVYVLRPWPIPRPGSAMGGLSSCVPDLLAYARFALGGGPANFLSDELRVLMHSPLAPAGNYADAIGTAWMLRDVDGVRVVEHGGATYGQQATLKIVPERNFAQVVLTNSSRGGELHTELSIALLREHLGLDSSEPALLSPAAEALNEYVGHYEAWLDSADVSVADHQLVVNRTPKGGFPTRDTPPSPPPPPTRWSFWAKDRILGVEGPMQHARAEFVRDSAGKITHLRIGGRLAARA